VLTTTNRHTYCDKDTHVIAGGRAGDRRVLLVVASVAELEVAGELQKRQRGRGEREQGEESECSEGAKDAKGEKEVQWRRGGGALKFGFRAER
jgi:hypothetical protein